MRAQRLGWRAQSHRWRTRMCEYMVFPLTVKTVLATGGVGWPWTALRKWIGNLAGADVMRAMAQEQAGDGGKLGNGSCHHEKGERAVEQHLLQTVQQPLWLSLQVEIDAVELLGGRHQLDAVFKRGYGARSVEQSLNVRRRWHATSGLENIHRGCTADETELLEVDRVCDQLLQGHTQSIDVGEGRHGNALHLFVRLDHLALSIQRLPGAHEVSSGGMERSPRGEWAAGWTLSWSPIRDDALTGSL